MHAFLGKENSTETIYTFFAILLNFLIDKQLLLLL